MRVLVAGHPLVVSANRQLWSCLAGQDDVEVQLIAPQSWRSNLIRNLEFTYTPETDRHFKRVWPLKTYIKGNASFFFFDPFSLWRILQQEKFDVIVLTQETWAISLFVLRILMLFSKNRRTPLFLSVCQNIKKPKLFFLWPLERFNTLGMKGVLCCHSEIRDVIRWKGIEAPCFYFPFSFESSPYAGKGPLEKTDAPVFGYIGRLTEEKGLEDLLWAFSEFRAEVPAARLIIAGAGPMEEKIRQTPGVTFMGTVAHHEAHAFYEDVDVLVLPSLTRRFWKEQFGRVLIEACAAGRLVVGSSSGAIPEVLSLLQMPYVFSEGNRQELLAVFRKLAEELRQGRHVPLVERSRKRAFELFSHDQVALRAKKLFKGESVGNLEENCLE